MSRHIMGKKQTTTLKDAAGNANTTISRCYIYFEII